MQSTLMVQSNFLFCIPGHSLTRTLDSHTTSSAPHVSFISHFCAHFLCLLITSVWPCLFYSFRQTGISSLTSLGFFSHLEIDLIASTTLWADVRKWDESEDTQFIGSMYLSSVNISFDPSSPHPFSTPLMVMQPCTLREKKEKGRGANFLPRHVHLPFLISRLQPQQSRHLSLSEATPSFLSWITHSPGSLMDSLKTISFIHSSAQQRSTTVNYVTSN